jgi:hypothetical protein
MRSVFVAIGTLLLLTVPGNAITIEFMQASITPANAIWLSGIACRNLDHIIHLDIAVS